MADCSLKNVLYLIIAVLSAIVLMGLGYYMTSFGPFQLKAINSSMWASTERFSDIVHPVSKQFEELKPNSTADYQTFISTDTLQKNGDSLTNKLVDNFRELEDMPLIGEPKTAVSTTNQGKTPLDLNKLTPSLQRELNAIPDGQFTNNDEKLLDHSDQPIAMKISIMVKKPNPWRNPFKFIGHKINSFFGKIFKLFSGKKKQTMSQ